MNLNKNINLRRTFGIISHPDAGKTTLTEKFLLYGGAIQLAGQVRAKGESRRTRSDFMKMEQDRGISVSASAMSFEYNNYRYNLVDTPGHSDFSEDTYRTLTAVDSAIMVIDGAKGVESQTKKLFLKKVVKIGGFASWKARKNSQFLCRVVSSPSVHFVVRLGFSIFLRAE